MDMSSPKMDNFTPSIRVRPVDALNIADLICIGEETNLSRWSAQNYLDELKNTDAVLLRLVADDNTTIGFVVGRFVPGGEVEVVTDAEIYNIAVRPDRQGKRFGQLLLDIFKAACHEREATNIWLEVRESNTKAIKFYEKNGFERVQTRPSFYENPREHAVLMRLILE
jgi:ribosomal-protein-alanine N-acetyltransferase